MPEETNSRLLWDWYHEKDNIEDFLTDPLKWVADELQKTGDTLAADRPLRKEDLELIKTLTDIIRFINANRKLLIPYT